ncbi:tetratricopeptide repeat protein [Hwanghaeella sp.]|uniref:tetratricopeptide repeat protein n=1 Tax=Hwanghaeella sp. TaxID=2605943 RepID=UPI003CCBAD45
MFGGIRIDICRFGIALALTAGLAVAVPISDAAGQTGGVEPWQTMSGEEQIRLYYLPRASAGDATAQYYLGHMYQNGLGVDTDKQAAADWYARAAAQNDPRALYRLGLMLQTGDGIPQDRPRAISLYRRAAEQGVLEAYFNMAQMVERGEGTAADPVAAAGMFEQLADAGMTEAMRELGRINAQREDRDLAAAWYWFALAAAKGDAQAGELARLIAGSMTEDELAEGQKRLGKSLNK